MLLIRAFIRTRWNREGLHYAVTLTLALGAIIYGTPFAKDYSAPSIVGDVVPCGATQMKLNARTFNLSANFCARRGLPVINTGRATCQTFMVAILGF